MIVRQKRLAENIEDEVEVQNEIIDDIGDGLERTTQRLIDTTQGVVKVTRTDSVWRYWITIVLLFIVIIIIVAI